VYEGVYDGTSATVTIYDNTPESIRNSGTPLYTNEYSGQGITQANSPPPQCQDFTLYKNIAFYANTKEKQSLSFTMQGTDGFNVISDTTAPTASYDGTNTTFTFPAGIINVPAGSRQCVLFESNANPAVTLTATFTATTVVVPGNYTAYATSNLNIFTSYIDAYSGSPQTSTRFFFVGRAAETTMTVGTTKASMAQYSSFTLQNADGAINYLFWYKINASDVFPTASIPAGSSVVAIDITSSAVISPEDVASFTVLALNATGDFYATSINNVLAISTADSGVVATGSAAFVIDPDASGHTWSITQTVDGTGENLTNNYIRLSSFISAGLSIQSTSKSLVKLVSSKINGVDVFYSSDATALPGSMQALATDYTTPQFVFTADGSGTGSTGAMFNPVFGTTIPLTQAYSQANTHLNRFYYSKQYEPESVPDLNYLEVGPQDKAILRIISLRNTLFILKEEAIYSLTGTDSTNFYITLFDSSTLLVAPDTAQVLNNQIYMLSSQGVATVTETGVGIVSRPIEDIFSRIKTSTFTNYQTASFAASYESDRAYILFTVYNTTDTYATKAYRYNTFTQAWTSWTWNAKCAVNNSATNIDKLYIGSATDNFVQQERKNLSRTDYADQQHALELVEDGISGTTVRLSTVSNVSVGDMLVQTQYVTLSQFNRLLTILYIIPNFIIIY
jgi:hypothetical protein